MQEANIARFAGACDLLLSHKIVLAQQQIAEILKAITYCPPLKGLFETVIAGYDFERAFASARVPGGINRVVLRYPDDKAHFLAFMFHLLVRFDASNKELYEFLRLYYYVNDDIQVAYDHFIDETVPPFKAYTLAFIGAAGVSLSVPLPSVLARTDCERVGAYVDNMMQCVRIDAGLDEDAREELLTISEALRDSVLRGDFEYVKALLIGAYKTFSQYDGFQEYFEQLYVLLHDLRLA
jgi:hypothetical protein